MVDRRHDGVDEFIVGNIVTKNVEMIGSAVLDVTKGRTNEIKRLKMTF